MGSDNSEIVFQCIWSIYDNDDWKAYLAHSAFLTEAFYHKKASEKVKLYCAQVS